MFTECLLCPRYGAKHVTYHMQKTEVGVIIPISQMGKLRPQEVMERIQGYTMM